MQKRPIYKLLTLLYFASLLSHLVLLALLALLALLTEWQYAYITYIAMCCKRWEWMIG